LQVPQLLKSVWRFTHVPEQFVSPVGQTQWPLTQLVPPVHAVQEEPQWFESLCVFVQVPLQLV
jgi:hypothetical protein